MSTMKRLLTVLIFTASAVNGEEIDGILAKANEGDVAAQTQVAGMYLKGEGVEKNPSAALEWYLKAAEQGDVGAQMSLGALYIAGKEVPKSSTQAAKWFRLAAEKGDAAAQVQMARMHLAGAGVPKDEVEAYKWARLACAQKNRQAEQIVKFLMPKMTAEQISAGQALLRESLEKKTSDAATEGVPLVAPPLE